MKNYHKIIMACLLFLLVSCIPAAHRNIRVFTGPSKPDFYCARVDAESRIAYDCEYVNGRTIYTYPKYYLGLHDSWVEFTR